MRIISIVGARPQFVKVAPISWTSQGKYEHQIIHTGQHYDPELSSNFFNELRLPEPIKNLYSGSGSHGNQTARILVGVEETLLDLKPDWIIVYGDTNSTIAATLAASKLGIRVAHVEAGLRSFNRLMPEEINRIGTDHLSDRLFAPTLDAYKNLEIEGLAKRSLLVGDVMLETLTYMKNKIVNDSLASSEKLFVTIHRAENTDVKERLLSIVKRLSLSPIPVLVHAHPRLLKKAEEFQIDLEIGSIKIMKPTSYYSTLKGIMESVGVITDSGGLQKEAYLLERPCLTVRSETEWIETLEGGWNQLDPDLVQIETTWWEKIRPPINTTLYGDGNASQKILDALNL